MNGIMFGTILIIPYLILLRAEPTTKIINEKDIFHGAR